MRLLPLFWFGLVASVLMSAIYRISVAASGDLGWLGALSFVGVEVLISVIWLTCIALVYQFVLKVLPSSAIGVIGFIHLFFAAASHAFYFLGGLAQIAMFSDGDFSASQISWFFGAAAITAILGYLAFLIAMIVALNSYRGPEADAFS